MPVPQIFITPTYMPVPDPVDMETVSALPPDEVDQLPQNAYAGELLMTEGGQGRGSAEGEAMLWICVVGSHPDPADNTRLVPAVWKQVLLGPPIEGKRDNPIWSMG